MKDYIGHHTCGKENGRKYVEENAPFLSDKNKNGEIPFLGIGYYFWEFDFEKAITWGSSRYNGSFFIIEAIIRTNGNFLDLAGDRSHMSHFKNLINTFGKASIKTGNFKLGAFIEILKRINVYQPKVFTFNIIRAHDYFDNQNNQAKYFFKDDKAFTYLNPRHIFCVFTKDPVTLPSQKIKHES